MDPGRDTGRQMQAVSLRHNVRQPGKLSKFLSPGKTERMGQERGSSVSSDVTPEEEEEGVEASSGALPHSVVGGLLSRIS